MRALKTTDRLHELTVEQKERTDDEYVRAVDEGLAAALKEADQGELIPLEQALAQIRQVGQNT